MEKEAKITLIMHRVAVLVAVVAATLMSSAQVGTDEGPVETPQGPVIAPSYAWRMIQPLGLREPADIDTLFQNYSRESVPSEISSAWACTGNAVAEGLNMIFDERPAMSDFFFRDAVAYWLPSAAKAKFYNTRIPMTLLSFNTAGGRDNGQELLRAVFSGNINAKAQVGAMLDYLYSKGCYANQHAKDLNWGFSGSYLGDRYEFQGFYYHYNLVAAENGGITDMGYIRDPAELQGGVTTIDPKSIPTRLSNAFNRVSGQQLTLNNRYKVGYWHEETEGDSVVSRTYIPVTSFIYTLDFTSGKHVFTDGSPAELQSFYGNTYLNPTETHDLTSYWTVSNTLGVSLLEGFNKYAKFGLSAYLTHQVRRYTLPVDTLDHDGLDLTPFPEGLTLPDHRHTDQLAWVGAQLTKQRGAILRYSATAELGILGPVAGDVRVNGTVDTRIPLGADSLEIAATGSFVNEEAPYLAKHYISNHHVWNNDMGKRRTLRLGGSVAYARTGTTFSAMVSNLQNHIYFDTYGSPVQHGGSVQVLSLQLQQNIRAGIFHWDNRITYQTTGNDAVVPLPKLSVYSNMYIESRIATLRFQLGVDCDYYTRYYAPGYSPATMAFTNQREMKLGNYPFCNIYCNMKLSKTRFYVMFSHFNQGLFGGSDYFSMPYYPLNPRRFQLGISIDFAN